MGANLPAKKYSKKSPTVTRLSFELGGGSTQFIDIGAALSAVNRKAYRAGLYYYVNNVEIYNNETGVVDFHTLPDTWVTKNAWNRGFKLWQKMNRLAGPPLTSGLKPKYHDFKVYMDDRHRQTGTKNPCLYGINSDFDVQACQEWAYSQFVSADDDQDGTANADEFFVHMVGPHSGSSANWTSVGLIQSYADSRATVPQFSPEGVQVGGPEQNDPLVNVFDMSSEEQINDIIDNLAADNDEPPYPESYGGADDARNLCHVTRIGTEVGVGRIGRGSGFCAPFGLICIDPHGIDTNFRVVLNIAVGTYHGVHAERA